VKRRVAITYIRRVPHVAVPLVAIILLAGYHVHLDGDLSAITTPPVVIADKKVVETKPHIRQALASPIVPLPDSEPLTQEVNDTTIAPAVASDPVRQKVPSTQQAVVSAEPATPHHESLPAVPGLGETMNSIDIGDIAANVEELGMRTNKIETTLANVDPIDVETKKSTSAAANEKTPTEHPLPKLSAADEAVHSRLAARLEELQSSGDTQGIKAAKAELSMFESTLETTIEFRIVDRKGEKPGFWRTLVDDAKTKQFYVVVEAIVEGKPVNWAVRDADSGKVVSVAKFGLRVDEKTFTELSTDKRDNGRISNLMVGLKPIGRITPVWSIKTDGETITGF
jgi:hypothetical protein